MASSEQARARQDRFRAAGLCICCGGKLTSKHRRCKPCRNRYKVPAELRRKRRRHEPTVEELQEQLSRLLHLFVGFNPTANLRRINGVWRKAPRILRQYQEEADHARQTSS